MRQPVDKKMNEVIPLENQLEDVYVCQMLDGIKTKHGYDTYIDATIIPFQDVLYLITGYSMTSYNTLTKKEKQTLICHIIKKLKGGYKCNQYHFLPNGIPESHTVRFICTKDDLNNIHDQLTKVNIEMFNAQKSRLLDKIKEINVTVQKLNRNRHKSKVKEK